MPYQTDETFLLNMLSASPDTLLTVDADGNVVYINRRKPGFPFQTASRKTIGSMLLTEHRQPHVHMIDNVFKTGVENTIEYAGPDHSSWTSTFIPLKKRNRVEHVMVSIRDVSDYKRYGSAQRRSHQLEALGSLATGIAHDFNNILWIIEGNAELASAVIEPGDPAGYHIEQVANACSRAKDLVMQIINVTRSSKQTKAPLKFSLIVREFIGFLRSSVPSTIKIQSHFASEQDTVYADIAQINQLLINICTNAVQAMTTKKGFLDIGLVNVTITEDDKDDYQLLKPGLYIVLSVRDTGRGIKPDMIDQIFNPYFTTQKKSSFSGMGLTIAKDIAETHKGTITVQSEPGKGSVFYVFLPCIESSSADIPTPDALPKGSETILFIDDEKDIVDAAKRLLTRLGYRVLTAQNAGDAIHVFKDQIHRIDLVITDMTMPDMTGIDLSKTFFSLKNDIPIILCTGYGSLMTLEKAKKTGFKEVILKPVSRKKLSDAIRKALDR